MGCRRSEGDIRTPAQAPPHDGTWLEPGRPGGWLPDKWTHQKDAKLAARGFMHESDPAAQSAGAAVVLRLSYVTSRLFD